MNERRRIAAWLKCSTVREAIPQLFLAAQEDHGARCAKEASAGISVPGTFVCTEKARERASVFVSSVRHPGVNARGY